MDDATTDNGCMRFHRGGHKLGPLPHFPVRDFQLCDASAPAASKGDAVVAIPLGPGGLVILV